MDVTLHSTPRRREVVLEQLRIVGLSLGPAALVVASVLAVGTAIIVGEIMSGGPGFDSDETFPTALIAFLFPFAVWRNEKRFGPAFLWTFPVERRLLALAKVFAGFVWFMAALAFFALWLLVLGLITGASPAQTVARIPFVATIGMYLFGSALVLGLRHALRWLLGVAGVLFLIGTLGEALSQPDDSEWAYVPGARGFFAATSRLIAAWLSLPESAQWATSTFLWIAAGLAALWAALSRHRERRRH
ncbi:MAG TPA: hypothetical protein VE010_17705 [Thermoanaerobaculia bacterium]|nr:hypothetical protein [Thermoanaerobaculia bacterium]